MHSLWLICFVVFASVSGTARGDGDCTAGMFNGGDCCNTSGIVTMHNKESVDKCVRKYFGGSSTTSKFKNALVCVAECILFEEGLLNKENKLDRPAIIEYVNNPYADEFRPIIHAVIEQCFRSYEAGVDSTLECTSGSYEFSSCFTRESFLTCHRSLWTPSPACEELKVNVTKCPQIPVMMGSGWDNFSSRVVTA